MTQYEQRSKMKKDPSMNKEKSIIYGVELFCNLFKQGLNIWLFYVPVAFWNTVCMFHYTYQQTKSVH